MILAAFALGLVKSMAGTMAVLLHSEILTTINYGGIPRWIPHAMGVALASVAVHVAIRGRRRLDTRLLSAWWAIGAGALCRPALHVAGWPEPRLEWLMLPLGAAMICITLRPYQAGRTRFALVAALAPAAVTGAALLMPVGIMSHVSDVTAYVVLAAATAPTVRLASIAHHIERSRHARNTRKSCR